MASYWETWALARVILGMGDDEFLARTPYELGLLFNAHITRLEIADGRFGVLCSLIANIHRDKKKQSKPFTPADFMPNRRKGGKAKPGKRQTTQQQIEHFKAITAFFGGKIDPRHGKMTQQQAASWLKAKA